MSPLNIQQRACRGERFPGSEELHPVLARVYAAREIDTRDKLDYSLSRLLPPMDLQGMDEAVNLLVQALELQQRVLVVGDFDADGATSTAVAVEILAALGLQHVDYLVPDRFKYGYGLTPEIVEVALDKRPDLIITVDNGIASVTGVEAAQSHGIKVLITDHHLAPEQLPSAEAIVNPNQPGDNFASKSLAGVGVIFYLMMALRTRLRETGWFDAKGIAEPNLSTWLDLVAVGTVADMVKLDYNNRILVANGLARIRQGKTRPGINAILQLANRERHRLSATDLGFVVGPRINAAGRLDDMSIGIECLLSKQAAQAMEYATRLENLNAERRNMQSDMQQQAIDAVATLDTDGASLPHGVCLYDERWHQGIVGLIASRIKDELYRPVIAFAQGEDGNLKGSARSVRGIHIRDVLDSLATHNPGLLIKFGGHAMAAGLSIEAARLDEFSRAFAREIERLDHDIDTPEIIFTDGELPEQELTIELAELLRSAGPWGQGFPEPAFEGRFNVIESRVLKGRHLKFVLQKNSEQSLDAIAFNSVGDNEDPQPQSIRAVYRLDVNEFRGARKAQLIIDHLHVE